jgi:LysM repeat protein
VNSIKNTIVTVTLLAVSYGAYVVLSNPQPNPSDLGLATVPATDVPVSVEIPDTASYQSPTDGVTSPGVGEASVTPELPETANSPDWPSSTPVEVPAPVDATADAGPVTQDNQLTNETSEWDGNATSAAASFTAEPQDPGTYEVTSSAPLPYATDDEAGVSTSASQAGDSAFEEVWKLVQSSIEIGKLDDALKLLSVWYNEPTLSSEQTARCVQTLDELAGTVIYSQESFMEPAYVVQEGDTLQMIAERYNVPQDFLARINGIESPLELYPGESLKVVKGPFRAEVDPVRSEITVFLGRHYAGRFTARMGTDMPANAGEFEVIVKETGREYFDRHTGHRVSRDDPSNPYGHRWIGLRGDQITAAHDVGIHVDTGTPEAGCIAVSPVDADDLTAILSVGSRVTIRQ